MLRDNILEGKIYDKCGRGRPRNGIVSGLVGGRSYYIVKR